MKNVGQQRQQLLSEACFCDREKAIKLLEEWENWILQSCIAKINFVVVKNAVNKMHLLLSTLEPYVP